MGSSNSQPSDSQIRTVPKQSISIDIDDQHQTQAIYIKDPQPIVYLHEQYEELTYNSKVLSFFDTNPEAISSSDLFYITVCYPYYCQSVHNMIRQSIRIESIKQTREQPDYFKNFQFSENMDYNRLKSIERCQRRHKIRILFKEMSSPTIKYKENEQNSNKQDEITFNQILSIFRNDWSLKNSDILINLIVNFSQLTGEPFENFIKINRISPILSKLMGNDNFQAFMPNQDLNWTKINSDFHSIQNKLTFSKPRCCMNFLPSEPLHSIDIKGTVITHGICSNGKFLFVLTKEKTLSFFLIYRGMINKLVGQFNFSNEWEINDKTFMFCSQKWLFLIDGQVTYHISINDLIQNDKINFAILNQPNFQDINKACSNGATYSLIKTNGLLIFDADNDKLNIENKNTGLLDILNSIPDKEPIVTNGMYIGQLSDQNVKMIATYDLQNDPLVYVNNDCFPKDFNTNVNAVTIDILSCVYFSVICYDGNSKICSHPYSGAPDNNLFNLEITNDCNDDLIQTCLFKYLIPNAFSPSVPENLIVNSNQVENELKSLIIWIIKFINEKNLVKAFILLIDHNLQKYKSRNIGNLLLPLIENLLKNNYYKRLASALLINHFDLFFDEIENEQFKKLFSIFIHAQNRSGDIFNEWMLNKLSQSVLLSKITINDEFMNKVFGDNWQEIPRDEEPYSWAIDLLLIAQQNSFEEAAEIVKNDPMNLNNSVLIEAICSYAQFLISKFQIVIEKIIKEHPNKKDRKLNYNSILYTLISNFFALASPLTECVQFASLITNHNSQRIIKLLNDELEFDKTLELFIGYFDMIYTISISCLIRGGSPYQCENDFKWLIHGNFNNGCRNLTPPDLSQAKFFLFSLNNELITNVSQNLAHLYENIPRFKTRKEDEFIDQYILSAFIHQTNSSQLLPFWNKNEDNNNNNDDDNNENNNNNNDDDNENNNNNNDDRIINKEEFDKLKTICKWVRKMKVNFLNKRQREHNINNENGDNNLNYQKKSDQILVNIGILILLDPVLTDYLSKTQSEQDEYFILLENFIQNNDPYQFHKVLKAVPTRVENVLNGFEQLNSLFTTINNKAFRRIIIDGISRVDSFERLGYLLSNAKLNERTSTALTTFHSLCTSLVLDLHHTSILEIHYTILSACKDFKENAIKAMNELSSYIKHENCFSDPYFITVAGLAVSTSELPESFEHFLPIEKACIIQLMLSKKDLSTSTIDKLSKMFIKSKELHVFNQELKSQFEKTVWIKMLFTVFLKCKDDENRTLNTLLLDIFKAVAKQLGNDCLIFSTLPEIIYGFRAILNSDNVLSQSVQALLASVSIEEESLGDKILLFAILAGDISDYSLFYAIRNRYGKWLKYSKDNDEYCLSIPITPFTEKKAFDVNEIIDPVQDVDLDLVKGLSFDTILSFWDICMKDQGSLLCRFYLQTLTKYILTMDVKIPNKLLSNLSKSAKPYINYHILSSNQSKFYKCLSGSFGLTQKLLPNHAFGFGVIKQNHLTHLFAYNIMKLGNISFTAHINGKGCIIIHKKDPVVIELPSGIYNRNNDSIMNTENINININGDELIININENIFVAEPNKSIEFIAKSLNDIQLSMKNQFDFTNSKICFDNEDNLNVEYSNNIFQNDNHHMNKFVDDLNSIHPVEYHFVNLKENEKNEVINRYNQIIDMFSFNEELPFNGSSTMYSILSRKNEFNICNQLKSVILAQSAIKDPQSLDWSTSFQLIKSAVIAVGGFDENRLDNGEFPYDLQKGFFMNCSMNFIQSSNVQIFFIAIKTLIKSEAFMTALGKNLVIMAQDYKYHNLIYKKDIVLMTPDDLKTFNYNNQEDYLINFPDGTKRKIKIDNSGSWIIDTPIVLLLLLWIFIDNCTTSDQRICAKLALVDCMLIQSPMIKEFMPEFLSYIQDKLLFMPEDFDPIYIHHLSTLALKNIKNQQIINFYKFEKNCFNQRLIKQSISSQEIDLNSIEKIDLNQRKHNFSIEEMIKFIQLMKNYKSINDFPIWNFVQIWRTFHSIKYEKSSEGSIKRNDNSCVISNPLDVSLLFTFTIYGENIENSKFSIKVYDVGCFSIPINLVLEKSKNHYYCRYEMKPKESKKFVWICDQKFEMKIQMYKENSNDQLLMNYESLIADAKSFAVDWTDSDTDEFLLNCINIDFNCDNFLMILLESLNIQSKFDIHIVQIKVYCLFMINKCHEYIMQKEVKDLNQEEIEIKRLLQKYSRFISYQTRINQFTIQATVLDRSRFIQGLSNIGIPKPIQLNLDSSLNFMKGESNNFCDSMIHQLSDAMEKNPLERFGKIIWFISFKGSDAFDSSGLTDQTINMAINSFLYLKTGLCIISPNFTENTPNSITVDPNDMGDVLVIPYPEKDDQNTYRMLFSFGVVLGSMIRNGITQDIPFPLFIWNFLAGKPISKEDVYENDTRLRDQIASMKDGILNDQHWTYRDWNNIVKPILGFPDDQIVPYEKIDIYETLVIDLRIKSLIKSLNNIRYGLFTNQNITNPSFLSGGLILFACQGKKKIDVAEIIKRLSFESGNEQLKNNLITILSEYNQEMLKKFLLFVTAKQRPPNFFVVPDYCIKVKFDDKMKVNGLPTANTCFNKINIPIYPTLKIMKDMLDTAILQCEGMDNE